MRELKTNTTARNEELDIYRGCVMIYIVGFIHVIMYAVTLWENNFSSLILIAMPSVFYISGASYALSRKKSYTQYVAGRFKRIVIPLIIYLLFYFLINTLNGNVDARYVHYKFADQIINIIFHGDTTGHLWYIFPYIVIALLLPLLHRVSERIGSLAIHLLLLAIMVGIYLYPSHILCYLVSTFAGLYYMRKKPYNSYIVFTLCAIGMVIWLMQGKTWNMQINKFPANFMYLAYTTCALIILGTPLKWLCRQIARIPLMRYVIMQYSRYGYIIYLYHVHVISYLNFLYYYIYEQSGCHIEFLAHPACSLTVVSIATIAIMIGMSKIIDPINNAVTRLISTIWHKTKDMVTLTCKNK